MTERYRDLITGDLTLDYFVQRAAQGWKLAAIEWVREASTGATTGDAPAIRHGLAGGKAELPYGLEFGPQGDSLVENPVEISVLLLILEQIVKEKRITDIAAQLNLEGLPTRDGSRWTPTAVFDLLPRLIEVSPQLLKSAAWAERRSRAQA